MILVLKMPTLRVLIVFMLFTNTFYTVFDQQMFPLLLLPSSPTTEIGNATYGTLNSFLPGVPRVRHDGRRSDYHEEDRRYRNSLLLGATVMFLRIGLCGVFHDPVSVSIVKLFHSIEVPLFLPTGIPLLHPALRHQIVGNPVHGGFQIASKSAR